MQLKIKKALQLIFVILVGIFMVATVVSFAHKSADRVKANGPIAPPAGYPKLSLSTKVVTPTLALPDGAVLKYRLEILNTGAYTASDVTLEDSIPANTRYNNDAISSETPDPVYNNKKITWTHGVVGFDDAVVITFSVTVTPGVEGTITNTALISGPQITKPVSVSAETRITDHPIFEIAKSATPAMPGKNQPLTYELLVTNIGQPADNTAITVTDFVPTDTTFVNAGQAGLYDSNKRVVTWYKSVNLGVGATTPFTFTVNVNSNVTSGTLINNDTYLVVGSGEIHAGEPYSTKVIDPIFVLSKSITPDPPGSNTDVTYTLTVLNLGSKATNLVITDTVPSGVTYISGGDTYANGVVTWELPSLETRQSAQVTFTAHIGDIADVILLNDFYGVCSVEGACTRGLPVASLVVGPTFVATAALDPIAHKPGGGTAPVTPTLTIKNQGPGNADNAMALITFGRISVSLNDMKVLPSGSVVDGPLCDVPFPCKTFLWTGNLGIGDVITFTALNQSTIGGEEGTHYTATVVITDQLGNYMTPPVSAEAIGNVTHFPNLVPSKSAPAKIGAGQVMTYTIQVLDSGLSTSLPPPVLTETVPASVTVIRISDGGISQTADGRATISWTLPPMGPGDILDRSFAVRTDPGLVSGTLIVNDDYRTTWFVGGGAGSMTNLGEPVTTTVHEVGLIDSYKTVTPGWALPGKDTLLKYVVHVVNSGPSNLTGVKVNDIFPWEHSTYQRDAVASAGSLVSDVVSLEWTGGVAAYSEQLITFTTKVDNFFEGVLTNTATISHTSLKQPVKVTAVAYITDKPVLRITKAATPDPVQGNGTLLYKLDVTNLGQQATLLTVNDPIPGNTSYINGSASAGGQLVGNAVQWTLPVLNPGETLHLTFQVKVIFGILVVNQDYSVHCQEGVVAYGVPVITRVVNAEQRLFLPSVGRN